MEESTNDLMKAAKEEPEDGIWYNKVYFVAGYTDLRYGLRSLSTFLEIKLGRGGIERDTLYLFCGRKMDYIKGLVWKEDRCILLEKNLDQKIEWPRTDEDLNMLTQEQKCFLAEGLKPAVTKILRNVNGRGYFAAMNIKT